MFRAAYFSAAFLLIFPFLRRICDGPGYALAWAGAAGGAGGGSGGILSALPCAIAASHSRSISSRSSRVSSGGPSLSLSLFLIFGALAGPSFSFWRVLSARGSGFKNGLWSFRGIACLCAMVGARAPEVPGCALSARPTGFRNGLWSSHGMVCPCAKFGAWIFAISACAP
ncbi:hypothetical protein C8R47DRAFT_1162217 [Mycena vitilis]|nr:hypothetical protein C8R47DRAFT_1162217 [Mycena vitilis]